MQQNADITYYLITQFIGLVILAAVIIFFIIMIQKFANRLTNQMEIHGTELIQLKKRYEDNQQVHISIHSEVEKISSDNKELSKKISSLQQELSLLSSDYSDNQQVTKAIELARKGSNTKLIVEKTGLSSEEADAIVRFHGGKSSD